jgi:5,10-methylenetetrahydromethanopterin reductase
VRAGVLLLPHEPVARLAETARLAESCGYDHFWLADERFHREVYASLAVCASLTSRIRLGPCVTDPYSRHPALTAMAIATLDEIAEGRAVLGMGAGISGFAELGVVREKPAVAIREAVTLIRRLLAGETIDRAGEIVRFRDGRLDFAPLRASVPVYVASNGPLGQRSAGMVADGAIMEACGNPDEAQAFRAAVLDGAKLAGRDPGSIELVARLNACIADDGTAARDVLRLRVARTLGAGRLKFATLGAQGLALPEEVTATVADVPYAAGFEPYRPLLPFITDRVVDALTLAGTVDEIEARVVALERAGIGQVMIYPFPPPGGTAGDTIRRFGEDVMPRVRAAVTRPASGGNQTWR